MMRKIILIIMTILVFVGLFLSLRFFFCGPNYFVVKTAKPVAEKIADYIVKNGIPERLDKIPDLPYKVINCKRTSLFTKEVDLKEINVANQKEAEWKEVNESCALDTPDNYYYKISFWFAINYKFPKRSSGRLEIESSNTVVTVSFKKDDNNNIIHDAIGTANINTNGICRSFKQ